MNMFPRRILAVPKPIQNPNRALAATLDRLADQHLQSGHHHQAERLAFQAEALREVAR